jgi:hypothetical protein
MQPFCLKISSVPFLRDLAEEVTSLSFIREVRGSNSTWDASYPEYHFHIFLLSRPTNAQDIYINNILYIVSTATCFVASAFTSYQHTGNTNIGLSRLYM